VHLPLYVGTARGVWRVNGDKIAFDGRPTVRSGRRSAVHDQGPLVHDADVLAQL
jgi:hypothetical protein